MTLQQVFMANMKKHRKQLGFTQEKLAEMCNTDPCYIRQIEIGRRFPSIRYIENIAKALNIAPYWLFFDETDTENDKLAIRLKEQKQEIKSILVENFNYVCSLIDNRN